jgi:cell division septal protein FtsQ
VALSAEQLRDVADLEGHSIVRPDFGAARERLRALPMVKDARITRDWPNGATVVVEERVPWGLWQVNNQSFVIDEEGVVLDVPASAGSPAIVQVDAREAPRPGDRVEASAIAVARQLFTTAERTVGRRLARLEYSQASGLTAVLAADGERPEVQVIFGDAQAYEYKVATLFAVLQREEEQGRVVRHVDLRFGDRVSVQAETPATGEEGQP